MAMWIFSTMAWWAFAFLPSEQTSPEWVVASRNACFGTLANGLPDGGGWIMLIGAPLTLLAAIFAVFGEEVKKSLRGLLSTSAGKTSLLLLTSLFLFQSILVAKKIYAGVTIEQIDFSSPLEGDLPEHYPRGSRKAPGFEHVNHLGEKVALDDLLTKHKSVTLSFAFAQCKTVCPMIVNKIKSAAKGLEGESSVFVMITLDPWRDTEAALASWANQVKLPDNAHMLTNTVEEIEKTLKAYNVSYSRNEKTGNVDHAPLTYVIDSEGKLAYTLGNVPPSWITQAIKRVTRQ